ncbi:MAG: VWA domain-containing protein [Acidobacteriia bacterium]|nr:VWA domain-containing protein [Terriglobia bacterium]
MHPISAIKTLSSLKTVPRWAALLVITIALCLALPAALVAQSQPSQSPSPTPSPTPAKQTGSGEAGGPQGDIGPIAIPKKKDEPPKKEEAPKGPKKIEGMPEFTLRASAALVTLDVGVLTKDGIFVPGLKQQNFRVLEDGVPQTITSFGQTQAPITAVMLVEFSKNFYAFAADSIYASATFAQTMKKEDWIALITYDIRPHILADFTQDKRDIYEGLRSLQFAMSAESNLFDALYDTIDRLEGVEGRKYIILISSGRDTFSKRTLDQMLKKIQGTKDIAIYTVSTGQALRNYAETHGLMSYLCGITTFNCNMEFLQADNQLKSFAKMTGGRYYQPLFSAQFREAFGDMAEAIRNQYAIAYHPSNSAQDGAFRKIKVELVGPDGSPLKMRDQKGKDVKYQVIARDGYKAKREVE